MEEPNTKNEFLGKKRENEEINLDKLSNNDIEEKNPKKEKLIIPNLDDFYNINNITQKEEKCAICTKTYNLLKFQNINDIIIYIYKENIHPIEELELNKYKNIIFNSTKILCQKCLKLMADDKRTFYNFFIEQEINSNNKRSPPINEVENQNENQKNNNVDINNDNNNSNEKNFDNNNNIDINKIISNKEIYDLNNLNNLNNIQLQNDNNDLKNNMININQINPLLNLNLENNQDFINHINNNNNNNNINNEQNLQNVLFYNNNILSNLYQSMNKNNIDPNNN